MSSTDDTTPLYRQRLTAVPLIQAFPQFEEVKEFRSKQCLFNEDRSRLFNVVSRHYQPIHHGDLVDSLVGALHSEFGADAVILPQVRTIGGGARMVAKIPLPFLPPVEIGKGDFTEMQLHVRNSYDSMWLFQVRLGGYRVICSNGMVIGKEFGRVSGKHFTSLLTGGLGDQLTKMLQNANAVKERWQEWADTKMTRDEAVLLLEDRFPKKYLEPVLSPERYPRSKWELFNDLTEFATHRTKSLNRTVELEAVIDALFYNDHEAV